MKVVDIWVLIGTFCLCVWAGWGGGGAFRNGSEKGISLTMTRQVTVFFRKEI